MEQTSSADKLVSTEDVVLEILHRVSTDVAALFRCSLACKRWRALVTDRSFLRRCGLSTTLLGFFDWQRVDADVRTSYRLYFVPPQEGSVLGAQRRLLTSLVDGGLQLLDDDSHSAEPLAARRGLLLLRLVSGQSGVRFFESVDMAVCDPLAGKCHLLPPLECRVTFVSCTVLSGAEWQRSAADDYFKVLAIVVFSNHKNKDDQECNLYTFSSTESRWSAPTKCFDEIGRIGKRGFQFPRRSKGNVVMEHGATTTHWLVEYCFDDVEVPVKYYTLDVSSDDTCRTSLTELPIPANQLGSRPTLRIAADGLLSLFCINCIDDESHTWRLHMWTRGDANSVDGKVVWLKTRTIELNLPRQPYHLWIEVQILPVEKSDTLFFIDEQQCVHKIDAETETVEEQQFNNAPGMLAMPMNIEWPTLFASRLG